MKKRLYRSRSDRMLGGVCGGLAEYFDIDPTIVRLVAVLTVFLNGLGLVAYVVMAIVVPVEGSKRAAPTDIIKDNVEEMKETATKLGRGIRSTFVDQEEKEPEEEEKRTAAEKAGHRGRNIVGIVLIIVGILFLFGSFGLFDWLRWGVIWPLILVAIGAIIIATAARK